MVYMETLRCDDVAKHGSPVRLNWKLTKLVTLTKMGKKKLKMQAENTIFTCLGW